MEEAPMPGTINWTVTYIGSGPEPVVELYNVTSGSESPPVVIDIPCNPPVACPWPTENLAFGDYKAAVRSGANRYFYIAGGGTITAPNTIENGSVISLSSGDPTESVKIKVQV